MKYIGKYGEFRVLDCLLELNIETYQTKKNEFCRVDKQSAIHRILQFLRTILVGDVALIHPPF